jgi:ketosteroid isomerase-like protein
MKTTIFSLPSFTVFLILALTTESCRKEESNSDKEKKTIEFTIRSSIGWAANKNLTLLYTVIADDPNYLEVHPSGKVVKGISEFRKNEELWMDPRFRALGYKISDLQIYVSSSGSVAWWYCILDDINEWDGEPASWENTRWTGVLEKRNGKWVIVQMHFSFAMD